MNEASVEPAPGRTPNAKPRKLPRRMAPRDRMMSAFVIISSLKPARDGLRRSLVDLVQHLPDREETDHHLHERDAREQVDRVERVARGTAAGVDADAGDEESHERHQQAERAVVSREADDRREPQDHHRHHLRRTELQCPLRERRRQQDEQQEGDDRRDERTDRRDGQRCACPPLSRHLVAVDGGHHARGLARCGDEDGRDRPAVLRAVVDPGEHDQRGDRFEGQGQRQQHRDAGGGSQSREDADDGAHEDADEAPEQVLRRQRRLEAQHEVVEHLLTTDP